MDFAMWNTDDCPRWHFLPGPYQDDPERTMCARRSEHEAMLVRYKKNIAPQAYDPFALGRMRFLDLQVLLYRTRPEINEMAVAGWPQDNPTGAKGLRCSKERLIEIILDGPANEEIEDEVLDDPR